MGKNKKREMKVERHEIALARNSIGLACSDLEYVAARDASILFRTKMSENPDLRKECLRLSEDLRRLIVERWESTIVKNQAQSLLSKLANKNLDSEGIESVLDTLNRLDALAWLGFTAEDRILESIRESLDECKDRNETEFLNCLEHRCVVRKKERIEKRWWYLQIKRKE